MCPRLAAHIKTDTDYSQNLATMDVGDLIKFDLHGREIVADDKEVSYHISHFTLLDQYPSFAIVQS